MSHSCKKWFNRILTCILCVVNTLSLPPNPLHSLEKYKYNFTNTRAKIGFILRVDTTNESFNVLFYKSTLAQMTYSAKQAMGILLSKKCAFDCLLAPTGDLTVIVC